MTTETPERCWEWIHNGDRTRRCDMIARWRSSGGSAYCDDHKLTGCTPIPGRHDDPEKPRPCRHRHHWLYGGPTIANAILWCYECGAIRDTGGDRKWVRPVGQGGENPAMRRAK